MVGVIKVTEDVYRYDAYPSHLIIEKTIYNVILFGLSSSK